MLRSSLLSGGNRLGRLAGTAICAILLHASSSSGSLPASQPEGERAPLSRPPAVSELTVLGTRSFVPAPKRAPTRIVFQNGIEFDARAGEPVLPANLLAPAPAPGERLSLLVQTEAPVQSSWLEELAAAGARVECFVPNAAFLVRVDAEDRAAIEQLPFVRWTGLYHPAYRLSARSALRSSSGLGEYVVLLFDDGNLASVAQRIATAGGRVVDASDNGINKILRIELAPDRLAEVAAHPDVQWLEPRTRFSTENNNVQWVDMTFVSGNRKVWDQGIDGTGQVVMVGDSGIRTTHDMFVDSSVSITTWGDYPTHRKIIAYVKATPYNGILFGDHSGAYYHGTHTSCTFAGNDDGYGTDARDGVAKGAKIYFLDAGDDSRSIYVPGDLNDYYLPAYTGNAGGAARISSNSWGGDTGGTYTTDCMTTDQFSWEHKDFLACYSNGNAGGANTVGSPAAAKNILSSGGTRNGTSANLIYTSTSRGPTDDNRYKPTVCSPGQNLSSASGAGDSSYQTLSGTSMSCPNLAGSAALVRQYFTDGWYPTGGAVAGNAFTPTAALLRAMIVNSGVDDFSSYSIPDNNIGWGRILLDHVMYFPGDARRTVVLDELNGVTTGEAREYEVYVADASEDLKITLVWTDWPSTPAAAINLVNDLDLVVTQGATTYLGNVWSGGQSVTGGSRDDRNVEENVRRATPVVGTYTIRVEGANVPYGPQPYALVVSGGLGGAAGVLTLDAALYRPGQDLWVRVEDTDAGSSVSVTLASTTEPSGETLVLVGSDGVLEGSFPLLPFDATPADGRLSVSDGDQITVTYNDASPAHTTTATASVTWNDPEITDVSADPADITAIIDWTTDVPATSRIEFGLTPALGTYSVYDTMLVTAHSHLVEGLAPDTTYYYDVLSSDHAGNVVRDDFGGNHYRFTTGQRADVLLVIADETTLDQEKYGDAFASTGWTYNLWRKAQADTPRVGDSTYGLRSYKAIWWQVGWEQYPQFLKPARDSLTVYHDGGARIAVVSHDVAWAFDNMGSGYWSTVKSDWLHDILHASWNADPTSWSLAQGIAGDPISGGYTGGISYTPYRDGGAGDEVTGLDGTGTAAYVWKDNYAGGDNVAVRWVNGSANGTPGVGVWGGTPTRTVSMFFEWLNLNKATASDPTRADILDKTLQWLIGGDHPNAQIVAPNGGESFTSSPASISWTAATDTGAGRNLATTRLEYSDDGGQSWNLITNAPGSSPYSWDISTLPTGAFYRVRVVAMDDGSPTLTGTDMSDADFTIAIPGNETRGPVVIAGSANVSPNPVVRPANTTLTASITDVLTGGSNIVAAEWSAGAAAAAPGAGLPMAGDFGAVSADVNATVDSNTIPAGETYLWIRGQDSAGNWGAAQSVGVQVNGDAGDVAFTDGPVVEFALDANRPNPFRTDTRIRFALPAPQPVSLKVYNIAGRLVRTLVDEPLAAGRYDVIWDGRTDTGIRAAAGVYFYRVVAGSYVAERKMVRLR
jgi:hypothetical protein